jgi:hypothetical protein
VSEFIERMARALYERDPLTVPGDPFEPGEPLNGVSPVPWDDVADDDRRGWLEDARAVLEAAGEAIFRAGFEAGADRAYHNERGVSTDPHIPPDEDGAWATYLAKLTGEAP